MSTVLEGSTFRSRDQNEECSGNYLRGPSVNKKETELEGLKSNIYALMNDIHLFTRECDDVNVMTTLKARLQAAISVTKVISTTATNSSLQKTIQYGPNSNHEKQNVFHSTRKRRHKYDTTISKPSVSELTQARKKIKEEEPGFCGICFKKNDSGNSAIITWFQCIKCQVWVHQECAMSSTKQTLMSEDEYVCPYC